MSPRAAAVATATAAAAVAVGARLHRARRVSQLLTGDLSGVRTGDGVGLHTEIAGPPGAPVTVVLVHGFGADCSMYARQWEALRDEARLVRYDQRGHGRSGWTGYRSATPRRLGRDLAQIVDATAGVGPVVLVGHSMGGMAVLALARKRPHLFGDRITGVALLSTLAAPLTTPGRDVDDLSLWLRTVAAAAISWGLWLVAPVLQALDPVRTRAGRRELRRRLFAGDPPEGAVEQMTTSWSRTPAAVMTAYLPGLAGYDQRAAVQALGSVPVLVLAGEKDATIPASAARRLAERIGPTAHLVLVPGAGHMVPLTHPGPVDAALRRLLRRSLHHDESKEPS